MSRLSAIDEKFQRWKAGRPAAQQAWEVVLEANLGGFYLPIYKRAKVEGKDTIWDYLVAASIVERNQVAAALMEQHGIAVNDLFAAVTPHLAAMQNPNDVHFNGAGYEFLGRQVAAAIAAALK